MNAEVYRILNPVWDMRKIKPNTTNPKLGQGSAVTLSARFYTCQTKNTFTNRTPD